MSSDIVHVPLVGLSRKSYDILSRIADENNLSIRDLADEMIELGLKSSKFHPYLERY